MAGLADTADRQPPRGAFVNVVAAGCALAAYVCFGAPGLSGTVLPGSISTFEPATGWLPAAHLAATAMVLAGGGWVTSVVRSVERPGVFPLALFALFQFGLLVCGLANLALATAGLRFGGDGVWAAAFLVPGLAAIRLHSELYMAVLRLKSWVRSFNAGDHGPLTGGALIALTVASNLVPLALCFQSVTTHSGAVLSALFRRAAVDPAWYANAIWSQVSTVSPQESWIVAAAAAASICLGAIWSATRFSVVRRTALANRAAALLSPAQLKFVDDALPAAVDAVQSRASSNRYIAWTFLWMLAATPILLTAAYAAAMWFGTLQELHALSWTANAASDLTPFASGDTGWANYAIPAALIYVALAMSAPIADLFFRGARYDRFAFGQPMDEVLRARLVMAVRSEAIGPNRPFDAGDFANKATRRRYWVRIPLAMFALGTAAMAGFWDVARGVAFTGDGLIVQEHYFAPARLVRFHEVQAIALDCHMDAFYARPIYELTLPGGRQVDMIGAAPLPERLDQYIAIDQRLQFSGVGYAYPPRDLEPCLKAIQKQHNGMVAAGAARLLHVLD